ncbi:MAG: class I SAM-dependent methyltransferase [Pseudohongiella sp.]|uniref:class I SAM-dependent methyltransferase n=1 Tax=Pseudohongiella sp. TaxID=1979412 RepID=UPI0034A057FA
MAQVVRVMHSIFLKISLVISMGPAGILKKVLGNVRQYAKYPNRVRKYKVDSIDLAAGVSDYPNDIRYSLFSIDGCHTALHTCNDLIFAERVTSTGGVVIIDDINNISRMGVFEGVCKYLHG